ncbi:hypothetical protein [Emticicia sp. BO119]|uniref:hypothetical protein n=1 Tax=Emticicia sp. BO119 TaxID=2757768 RepID=UPI0015F064B3|nr:hypothetical protein [Emticicia sp. BO119]MBA4850198.1 hypothetical protein [Emticicia sp. BO119]
MEEDFDFKREITDFRLEDFREFVNWKYNPPRPFKILLSQGGSYFYLYDENKNKMYEVDTNLNLLRRENADSLLDYYKKGYDKER